MKSEISSNLRQLRKDHSLTQKQVADRTGINIKSINSYETGRCNPPYSKVILLAKFFNVSIDFLITSKV